ncbi:MAG: sigma-70 family RNA polymerase sigma factor [Acidobacteriaceae bacterium]|nr:sigma-70 family RNA polymerase sigma factor [Acidobacteriaceae bacterium]
MLTSVESAGAEIELASLVESYSSLLFRVAHSVLRSRAEAEDVVQDTFVRVLQHQRSLAEIHDMRVWLVRIAWNLAIDRRRRAQTEQMDESFTEALAASSVRADRAFEEIEQMKAVLREIERLPKIERHALLLSTVEELDTTEIAVIMNRSESAVRGLLFRARTRLRERLEKGDHKHGKFPLRRNRQ